MPFTVDPCAGITRSEPDLSINKEIVSKIGCSFRVLPLFEHSLYEYAYTKHYSLKTNSLLKCEWTKYKKDIEKRVIAPFEFVDVRDYHFYNCRTRLLPSISFHTKKHFPLTLKQGPGVDKLGLIPIPQELLLKRGEQNKGKKQCTKVKVEKAEEEKIKEEKENEEEQKQLSHFGDDISSAKNAQHTRGCR